MVKYLIEWIDERTVFTEVDAKSEKEAIKKVLNGKGHEIDWTGSGSPNSENEIESIRKGD